MSLATPLIGNLTIWDLAVIAGTIIAALIIAQLVSLYMKRAFSGRVRGKDLEILLKVVYWAVLVLAVLLIFSQLRIDLSGLLIAGGFAGIVIGIASQSVVGNLISGIFLIIERPVSIGDEVRIGDVEGYVEDIRILSIIVRTHQGVYTRMPNEKVFTSDITNYVAHPARRVEYSIGVGHAEEVEKVRGIILSFLQSSPYALVRPAPEVSLLAIADDRLILSVYFWTPSRSFTPARSAALEGIQKELVAAGIEIPPPRRHISLSGGEGGRGSVSRDAPGGRNP
jgi:small-conductance mechanosensitive channel